jgi:RpiR family transcriptional regulator, carbohydrate utilization regulator
MERIRSMIGSLSVSERRVAQSIVDHPFDFLDWSTEELATQSKTSGATAIRACRRLGFSGLRDLRLTLARDLGWPVVPKTTGHASSHVPLIATLFDDASRSIATMVTKQSIDAFKKGARLLGAAEKILVVANGPSSTFGQDFVYWSRIGGCPTEFWTDTIMQTVVASQLGRKDVCVAVSASGQNALTIDVVEKARATGAKVVAVTGFGLSRLAEIATVSIVAETFDYSTISQTAINSAGVLLMLRGLAIAIDRRDDRESSAGASLGIAQGVVDQFSYRHPTAPGNGSGR